jgi:hypothetical protein
MGGDQTLLAVATTPNPPPRHSTAGTTPRVDKDGDSGAFVHPLHGGRSDWSGEPMR